jgi:outer membrane receptor for ferrienterochelin and colicins
LSHVLSPQGVFVATLTLCLTAGVARGQSDASAPRPDASAAGPDGAAAKPAPSASAADGGAPALPPEAFLDPELTAAALPSEAELAELSLEDLLSVKVVSASLLEEDAWSAPAVISVVSGEQMLKFGQLSLGEALQYQPGFYGINDHVTYNMGIRGVNGGMGAQSQVLRTMIAGRDIRFRPTGGSFLGAELIPRLAIRQVEVIRGPVSALYGADAFLGALNIIPNRAADMGPGHAKVVATALNNWKHWGTQVDGAVWGDRPGLDAIATFTVRKTDRGGLPLPRTSPQYQSLVTGLGRDRVTRDEEVAMSAFGKVEAQLGENVITLEGNAQYFRRDANFNFESSPLSEATVSPYTAGGALRFNRSFGERLRLTAFSAYTRGGITDDERLVDRFIVSGIPYLRRFLDYNSLENRAELTYSNEISSRRIPYAATVGGDYTYDDMATPSVIGYRAPPQAPLVRGDLALRRHLHNAGGFAQLRVRPLHWLSVLGGVRVENNSIYGAQVSYRLSMSYADERLTVKLLYGRSFKAPSNYLLYAQPVISGGPEANPNLAQQYAETGELYAAIKPRRWIQLAATGYVTNIDGFARIDTQSFAPRAQNSADLLSIGGESELTLNHPDSGLEGFAGVALARARETNYRGGVATTLPAPLYPAMTFSLGTQLHLRRAHLRLMGMTRYASMRRADESNVVRNGGNSYNVPAYNIVTLGVFTENIRFFRNRETEVGFRFDNVLMQNYAEPGFLGIDIPGEQWSFRITLSQQF